MARRGTWHGVPCHATPRFRVNVARRGTWRATRGAEIFTRATPCPVLVLTWRALCPGETWRGVACHARSGTRKTGRAITVRWRDGFGGYKLSYHYFILGNLAIKIPASNTFPIFERFYPILANKISQPWYNNLEELDFQLPHCNCEWFV